MEEIPVEDVQKECFRQPTEEEAEEVCEEPLSPPQPMKEPSKFEAFIDRMRERINSPKKPVKKPTNSKVYTHLQSDVNEKYMKLNEALQKIGAKQISHLKYYKDLPKISEEISLCYLHFFQIPIPKSHYWERFLCFLAQPGAVIQKFRQIPWTLEAGCIEPQIYTKINEVFSKIPKNDLNLSPVFIELQLLVSLLTEILAVVAIPAPLHKSASAVLPSAKLSQTCKIRMSAYPEQRKNKLSATNDNEALKSAISAEQKAVLALRGSLSRRIWDEKRYLKAEAKIESRREEEREIEIQKNTDLEFKAKEESLDKNQRQLDKLYGDLVFRENRNLKAFEAKFQRKQHKKEVQERFESMKWGEQWGKAKHLQEKTEEHQVLMDNLMDLKEYRTFEAMGEKREAERSRDEELNSQLKFEYNQVIKEKEALQKTLSLYQ